MYIHVDAYISIYSAEAYPEAVAALVLCDAGTEHSCGGAVVGGGGG